MKKFIKIGFVAVFAAIAGYGVYANQKNDSMSDLALANVEALAGGEGSSSDCNTYCQPDSRYTCYISWGSGIDGITCPAYRKKQY
ncbi:NVEALA domain-containing protein [uncultured Bacteroides sp.]|uniref:NVEALA domain-containing protein n=1 Tax=uncultured Bacteroides sp. TaxID=162156 RepID=UPI0025DD6B78|nr:NVEALA domain-containing protein [uncultured Bacteroides sp.]